MAETRIWCERTDCSFNIAGKCTRIEVDLEWFTDDCYMMCAAYRKDEPFQVEVKRKER